MSSRRPGIDTTGGHIGYSYDHEGWNGLPSKERLEEERKRQDLRIEEVRRRAGDSG